MSTSLLVLSLSLAWSAHGSTHLAMNGLQTYALSHPPCTSSLRAALLLLAAKQSPNGAGGRTLKEKPPLPFGKSGLSQVGLREWMMT